MNFRSIIRRPLPFVLLTLSLAWSACGGGNEEDLALITGQPTRTPEPPRALDRATEISQINFEAATEDLYLTMITEEDLCVVNATTEILVLAGDFAGRPVRPGIPVAFFVARGRGLIADQSLTVEDGTATATFQSLCPADFHDAIAVVAAVRGAEPFTDLDSDGRHDDDEPFVDLDREAFMDANLNGSYEPQLGEFLIWDEDDDERFDSGGNGRYDRDNIIVDYTLVLPVRASDLATPSPVPTATVVTTTLAPAEINGK